MKIIVAKDAGYCFGVRDAVNMAYDATEKYGLGIKREATKHY